MKWERKTLDELGVVSRGKSKFRPRNDPSLFGGKYPFIQTADVKKADFYITEFNETYNEKGLAQSKLWNVGTLCITIAANIADTAILAINACFPDSIMGFVPYEDKSDVRFVKYLLDVFQNDCKQISQGTAQDNLSWEKLSTIKFLVPDITTQRRIADILSAYDDLIENNRKQIKLLEEAAQRLYKEWFVELRFPGHEKVKVTDGVPEGWERKPIGSLIKFKNGFAFKSDFFVDNGKYGIVTIKNVQQNMFVVDKIDFIDDIPDGMQEWCYLHNGDILMSLTGNVGRMCYVVGENYLLNQRVAKVETKYPSYAYCLLTSFDLYNVISNMANGTAQQNLSTIRLENEKIILPSKNIIELFEKMVGVYVEKKLLLYRENCVLQEARDRLLPKLMSGEIEV